MMWTENCKMGVEGRNLIGERIFKKRIKNKEVTNRRFLIQSCSGQGGPNWPGVWGMGGYFAGLAKLVIRRDVET